MRDPSTLVFAFAGSKMLVSRESELPSLADLDSFAPFLAGPFDVGRIGDREVVTVALAPDIAAEGHEAKGLRELFGVLSEDLMSIAARASQILEWSFAHAFCGRCGSPTDYSATELARTCPSCGGMYYPRLTPARLPLVRQAPEIRLVVARNLGAKFYPLISGPGD